MKNEISGKQPGQVSSTPTTGGPEKATKPADLLKLMTGAPQTIKNAVGEAQKGLDRMSSALRSEKVETEDAVASAPKLPEKKNAFESILAMGKEAVSEAHQARRKLVDDAQPETLSGQKFNADDDAVALYQSGKSKAGTDEKAIRDLLWDRSPEQLKAVAATYADHYPGRNLWTDLDKEFEDPRDRAAVKALREGDRVGAATESLLDATTGMTSKTRVESLLGRLTPDEVEAVKKQYTEKHPDGKSLDRWVERKFGREKEDQMKALLSGDSEQARVNQFQFNLRKKKGDELVSDLRGMNAEQIQDLTENFNKSAANGEDLESLLSEKLKGTDRDQALALLWGDKASADAALVRDAIDGLGSNKTKLRDGLGSDIKDPDERAAYMKKVEASYDKMYGPDSPRKGTALRTQLAKELGGENEDKALTLLDKGEIPPEKKLVHGLSGSKEDPEAVAEVVKKYGPERAREMYREATKSDRFPEGRDLDADVESRLGGRGRFDVKDALAGPPETPEDKVARAAARAEFEHPRDGKGMRDLGGRFTDADEVMWTNVGRAEGALKELKAAREAGDTSRIAELELRINELTGYAEKDVEVFRDEKDGAVETVAMAATTGVGVALTIGTGGLGAPLLTAALVAGAGAATNVGLKSTMQGGAYNWDNALADGAWGAAEGIGIKGGNLLGRAAREAGKKVAGEAGEATLKSKLYRAAKEGVTDGAFGGTLSVSAETALKDETWEEGWTTGLGRVGFSGVRGLFTGVALGGTVGPTTELAGAGVGSALNKLKSGQKPSLLDGDKLIETMGVGETAQKGKFLGWLRRASKKSAEPPKPTDLWKTDAYREMDTFKALGETDQKAFQELIDTTRETQSLRPLKSGDYLVRMLESGRLMDQDKFGNTVLDHLDSFRTKPRVDELADDSTQLLESAIRMVADPNVVHQGNRGACAAVAVQFLHAKYEPADFLRVTEELTRTRKTTWMNGDVLELEPNSLKTLGRDEATGMGLEVPTREFDGSTAWGAKDRHASEVFESNRSALSRIYQSSAMNDVGSLHPVAKKNGWELVYDNSMQSMEVKGANDEYFRIEKTPETEKLFPKEAANSRYGGFRILKDSKHVSADPSVGKGHAVADGLSLESMDALMGKALGGDVRAYKISDMLRDSIQRKGAMGLEPGDYAAKDLEALQELIIAAQRAGQTGKPITLGVDWAKKGQHSGHAIALLGLTAEEMPDGTIVNKFLIKNSQFDGIENVRSDSMPRESQYWKDGKYHAGGLDGVSAVDPEVFLARLRGFQIRN